MKLAELRALVEAMTEGPWTETKPGHDANGWAASLIVAAVARGQCAYADAPRGAFPAAALTAIVALRNHADALMELLSAAEFMSAEQHCDPSDPCWRAAMGKLERALNALEAIP